MISRADDLAIRGDDADAADGDQEIRVDGRHVPVGQEGLYAMTSEEGDGQFPFGDRRKAGDLELAHASA
ncbi:MAG: hypothetical protein Q8Q71_08115 [Brevundimonas sp.]|nr:hypothetical protein [Brevundimonas sp.]